LEDIFFKRGVEMKFTSEDLMKAMGLQVGDKIKFYNEVFTIVEIPNNIGIENDTGLYNIDILLNKDFEILPRPKRVGELKCGNFKDCEKCPLVLLCELSEDLPNGDNFYEMLEMKQIKDKEIYDLLKARLDKVVEE
jgi:hypothetical protein